MWYFLEVAVYILLHLCYALTFLAVSLCCSVEEVVECFLR